MIDGNDPAEQAATKESASPKKIAVEVSGKDAELWKRREPRFVERLKNSFKKLLRADIPSEATANQELLDMADSAAKSARATLDA